MAIPMEAAELHKDLSFVYLADVAPDIIQSVRYAGNENFIGRPITGYKLPMVLLTIPAAEALCKVQAYLKPLGYGLVVYDGYRPQQAVDDFWQWSQDIADQLKKAEYYPTINKADAFKLGYISRKSGHTRGGTVDLSIIELDKLLHEVEVSTVQLRNGEWVPFLDDGTVNMGSSFDLFHEVSWHDTSLVDDKATANRNLLREAMKQAGFKEYSKEWWHYTLKEELYPDTYFDFPVE